MMNLYMILSAVVSTMFAAPLQCNYIDMGFNLIQPVNECVIGKLRSDEPMSMAHYCVDGNKVESRVWWNTNDCSSNEYSVINTYDCNSNTTFVKCNCQSESNAICTTVTYTQYVKQPSGGCDTSQITEFRQYIVEEEECPESFIDSNCFERACNKKS